jgi:hypothetical protein
MHATGRQSLHATAAAAAGLGLGVTPATADGRATRRQGEAPCVRVLREEKEGDGNGWGSPCSGRAWAGVVLAVLLGPLGCEPSTPASPHQGEPEQELTLGPERVRIGSVDGTRDALSSVAAVLSLRDRTGAEVIGVLLPQAAELRVFRDDGEFLVRIGGRGAGPSEFQTPARAGMTGDDLWIEDTGRSRITVMDLDGTVLRTVSVPRDAPSPHRNSWTSIGLLADGRLLIRAGIPREEGGERSTEGRWPVFAWTPEATARSGQEAVGERADTLLHLPRALRPPPLFVGGMALGTPRPPITADHSLLRPAYDGSSIVVLERHEEGPEPGTRLLRVFRIGLNGDTLHSYREAPAARPVPAELRSEVPSLPGMEEFARYLFQEEHLPVATDLMTGVDGSVWIGVQGTSARTNLWWILDQELRPIARFPAPEGLELHQVARDRIWAVDRDELDVPYVVVYELVPAG